MEEQKQQKTTKATQKVEKEETITIKKQDLWKYSTFVLLAVVVILAIVIVMGNGAPTGNVIADNPSQAPTPSGQGAAPSAPVLEIADNDWVKGDPNAPVKIFEWSDFECPFCGRFYSQTLPSIDSQYIENGDVALIFKHFPLSFHPNAQKAAEATECAGLVGGNDAFWDMHDLIFENQAGGLSDAKYKAWAAELGLDQSAFDNCLDSGETAAKVQADFQEGQAAGVRGTPGFVVVTGDEAQLVSGAQPFPVFQQSIDAGL